MFQQQLANAAELFPIADGPLTSAQAALGVFANPFNLLPVGLGAIVAVNSLRNRSRNHSLAGWSTPRRTVIRELHSKRSSTGPRRRQLRSSQVLSTPDSGLVQGLQTLREPIAAAIDTTGVPLRASAKLPSATTNSFTLTAPVEKALPAPKASTPSVDEKSGAVDAGATASGTDTKDASGEATLTDTTDSPRAAIISPPATTSTKGGRHRADTGSFAQGLRDTIKGLTGLGREKKSDKETSGASASKSDESGSSSSGSGDSGSGGGSGSK